MQPDEIEETAAEFVLGTLSEAERREAEALLEQDGEFARAVRRWENRLLPLASTAAPAEPPARLRGRIMEAIGRGGEIVRLRRQVAVWRGLAAAGGALAAALAATVLWLAAPGEDMRYVAVLQPENQGPAFIASIDLTAGTISVRRVQAEAPAGKSYELWAIGDGRKQPESLGIIDKDVQRNVAISPGTILAVSLEPAGGSPTGQPTGPVVYTGKLVPTQ
jgi:anti-sigma-K factor RskA